MEQLDQDIYYERNLPHYQPAGATIFITFRLVGSLPRSTLIWLAEEASRLKKITGQELSKKFQPEEQIRLQKLMFGRWDQHLDLARNGPYWLSNPDVAKIVWETIQAMDGKQFILDACCIMPNHVHLVCTPLEVDGRFLPLSKILRQLKGSTARQANLILNRQGQFWQHESYDHVVQDDEELENIVSYVLENPMKVGLEPNWIYSRFEL